MPADKLILLLAALAILAIVARSSWRGDRTTTPNTISLDKDITAQWDRQSQAIYIGALLAAAVFVVCLNGYFVASKILTSSEQQLALARKQADDAKLQASAVLDEMRLINRPSVYFGTPTFSGVPGATSGKFRIKIPMGNYGNTATKDLSYEMNCYALSLSANNSGPIVPMQAVLGPRVLLTPTACVIAFREGGLVMDESGQTSKSLLVEGRAFYRDTSEPGLLHETRFAYNLDSFKFDPNLGGLTAVTDLWDINNCVDDKCRKDPWP